MSSTTDTTRERAGARGQILVIFAGGLVLILLIAALVFDLGQNLLDRRTEQNVADAAALAGARFLPAAYTYHGPCSTAPAGMPAVNTACDVAVASGYVDGANNKTVRVDIPPVAPSVRAGLAGHVEVTIGATRPSFFQGVVGVFTQRTGAMGVATNGTDIALPYSVIALDPHGCGTNFINGAPGTSVTTNGTVHVDSDCSSAALKLSGNGVLTAPECDVVGGIQVSGGAVNNCAAAPTGILVYGDPLRNLPVPPKPALPAAVQPLDGGPIPAGCPALTGFATDSSPQTCAFSSGPVAGKSYRLFPGDYPGGISTSKAILYLSPGVYWLGGGGLHIQSNGKVISKDLGDNTCCAPSGGVLLYNGVDPVPSSGCTGAGCYGTIDLNGGGGSTPTLALRPIQSGTYKNMVIFIDRVAATGNADVSLNGANAELTISGTIYAPTGNIRLNGSSTDSIGTQLICYNFQLNGSGAAFTLNYSPADLFHLKGVGLVE